MSVLLLGAHMSIAGGVSKALDRAASVGSNAVQVFTKNNRQWKGPPIDGEDVARWEEEHAGAGHPRQRQPCQLPDQHGEPEGRPVGEEHAAHYQDEIERAHAYGIPHVVVHPGAHTGSGEEAGIARIAAALNRFMRRRPTARTR